MWYIYTCGHARFAPNYRSNIEKKVNNPCATCSARISSRVRAAKTPRPQKVEVIRVETRVMKFSGSAAQTETKSAVFRKFTRQQRSTANRNPDLPPVEA